MAAMILAFEGAPAVGESTIAAALSRRGAVVVPEMNLRFMRPTHAPPEWYDERQVVLTEMARLVGAS